MLYHTLLYYTILYCIILYRSHFVHPPDWHERNFETVLSPVKRSESDRVQFLSEALGDLETLSTVFDVCSVLVGTISALCESGFELVLCWSKPCEFCFSDLFDYLSNCRQLSKVLTPQSLLSVFEIVFDFFLNDKPWTAQKTSKSTKIPMAAKVLALPS